MTTAEVEATSGSSGSLVQVTDKATTTTTTITYPTPEEFATLRRVPGKINTATYLIAVVELVERFSYYGTTVVFTNFIQRPLPPGSVTGAGGVQSGALGMGQQVAAALGTFNGFWVYICPLFGAYIADAHLGRYNTILISIFIALAGHSLLVISAIPSVIVNTKGSLACFIVATIIMGLGTGGFKPNISPLVAEQAESTQDRPSIKELPEERVIVDPALTVSRIYMYFYLMINLGALVGQIGMVYAEKYVGFWLAYLLPTVLFCICPLVMILGKPIYVLRPPTGSVFAQAMRLVKFGFTQQLRRPAGAPKVGFWEAIKPSTLGAQKPVWMNFDDQWVDEVKRGLQACEVFLWYLFYWLPSGQGGNMVSQAGVLNTHGMPNDIVSNINPLALIILIPICDLLIYPALRRAGINFSPLKKIAAGFIVLSAALVCPAIVQHIIYKRSACGYRAADPHCPVVDITFWVQAPSYVLTAVSEIFASITGLEYAFTLAPKNMRSLVTALFFFQCAVANAIGEAFNPLAKDPLLVWNYGTMAVIAFVAGVAFYLFHRKLDADHDLLIRMQEGHVGVMANYSDEDGPAGGEKQSKGL